MINSHVTKLTQYLTFEAGHDQIYEERADSSHLRSIDTRAKRHLLELISDRSVRLVVLTGDAGHGKTHLCRVVVEKLLGLDSGEAQRRLNVLGSGELPLGRIDDRELFVVRDMSELRDEAVERLVSAMDSHGRTTIVCANEGKLRDVISRSRGQLDHLSETLEASQRSGRTSIHAGVYVIDLNHQSITVGEQGGFLSELLQQWVMDGRRWRVCATCPATDKCPIVANRRLLAGEDDETRGERRRDGLSLLLRVAEQTGATITIREALILTAFLVTGGLDCRRVHGASARERDGDWEDRRPFFQVLFDPPLSKDQRATLPLLDTLARFDPGRVSIRSVDESLIAVAAAERALETAGANDSAKPRTRKQAQTEARRHRTRIAFLRRRDYFDLDGDDEWRRMLDDHAPVVARSERIGFRFFREFQQALDGDVESRQLGAITEQVVRGLEAVQDVRRGSRRLTGLVVVDPAYGAVSGSASIVANQISVNRITLCSRRAHWHSAWNDASDLPRSLDWLDRRVVVLFQPPKAGEVALELNLLQFEFVMRSAHGLACRRFYQGDIRRILARLSQLADLRSEDEDEILVIHRDRLLKILVKADGDIVCEGQP
ncbi:MAG: hypothetical protein IPM29_27785 [Planctomycetes bacterium]|nr:hypothetical protein [Planctomycetota bacterium]